MISKSHDMKLIYEVHKTIFIAIIKKKEKLRIEITASVKTCLQNASHYKSSEILSLFAFKYIWKTTLFAWKNFRVISSSDHDNIETVLLSRYW